MKLYVDLDQVLTDFDKRLKELVPSWSRDKDSEISAEVWKKIEEAGEDFWADMDWTPRGKYLWSKLKKYDPTILSSPSRHDTSVQGKKKWLRKNLPDVPYILESDKEKYAEGDAVLIDDRESNIKGWEEAGGKGILHTAPEKTLKELEGMMSQEKKASIVDTLQGLTAKIDKLGHSQEAYRLDVIAGALRDIIGGKTWEELQEFVERQEKGEPEESVKAPSSDFLFRTGPKLRNLAKNVLRRVKGPKPGMILAKILEAEEKGFLSKDEETRLRNEIRNLAFEHGGDLSEFLGLLISDEPGKQKEKKEKMYYLANKIAPRFEKPESTAPLVTRKQYRERKHELKGRAEDIVTKLEEQLKKTPGYESLSEKQKKRKLMKMFEEQKVKIASDMADRELCPELDPELHKMIILVIEGDDGFEEDPGESLGQEGESEMLDTGEVVQRLDKLAQDLEEKGLIEEAEGVDVISNTLEDMSKEAKWKKSPDVKEGAFEKYCKGRGYEGVCQECINDAVKSGGHPQKMALYAVNVSKGKYHYPKSKDAGEKPKGEKGDAKERSRPNPVFDHTDPKVLDDADHFPLNTEKRARAALSYANHYDGSPEWYDGSLSELKKRVADAVKKAYPDIEVSEESYK